MPSGPRNRAWIPSAEETPRGRGRARAAATKKRSVSTRAAGGMPEAWISDWRKHSRKYSTTSSSRSMSYSAGGAVALAGGAARWVPVRRLPVLPAGAGVACGCDAGRGAGAWPADAGVAFGSGPGRGAEACPAGACVACGSGPGRGAGAWPGAWASGAPARSAGDTRAALAGVGRARALSKSPTWRSVLPSPCGRGGRPGRCRNQPLLAPWALQLVSRGSWPSLSAPHPWQNLW